MIINSHVHVNTDSNYFFYKYYTLERLLKEMDENKIDFSFPALNPKLNFLRCPNDCSMNCPFIVGNQNRNDNLSTCNCIQPKRHRTVILEKDSMLIIKCKTCGHVVFKSYIDPLRKYNLTLLYLTKPYRLRIKPLIYISLCSTTIQSEIDFWEEHYKNEIAGFKLHPWNDQVSVANFCIHSSKPILIHTGIRNLESAKNAINFAINNPQVKVIIAHAAALDEYVLKKVSILKNVFIDCCPSVFLYENKSSSIFMSHTILSPEDIYYKVLDFIPSTKILFGTDSPWGNSKAELDVINRLHISESIREQILYQNAVSVYRLEFC